MRATSTPTWLAITLAPSVSTGLPQGRGERLPPCSRSSRVDAKLIRPAIRGERLGIELSRPPFLSRTSPETDLVCAPRAERRRLTTPPPPTPECGAAPLHASSSAPLHFRRWIGTARLARYSVWDNPKRRLCALQRCGHLEEQR